MIVLNISEWIINLLILGGTVLVWCVVFFSVSLLFSMLNKVRKDLFGSKNKTGD